MADPELIVTECEPEMAPDKLIVPLLVELTLTSLLNTTPPLSTNELPDELEMVRDPLPAATTIGFVAV